MAVTRTRGRNGRGPDEVSELDKRIIEHLQQDGRRPFTQIAAELGVSEAAVRARTNRLVERGILQVVGVTDPLKLGFQQMAMIGIRCEADRLDRTSPTRCAELPEVDYVVITAGTYDILIETVCEDNEAPPPTSSPSGSGRSRASATPRRSCTCGWSSRRTSGARARPRRVRCAPESGPAAARSPQLRGLSRTVRAGYDAPRGARSRRRLPRSERAGRSSPGRPDPARGRRQPRAHAPRPTVAAARPRGPPRAAAARCRPRDRRGRGSAGQLADWATSTASRAARLRPGRPGRVSWVFILADLDDRRRDRPVARDPAGDLRRSSALAGLFVLVVHDLLPPGALGPAQVRPRGQRRDHLRDAPRGPDRAASASPFFFAFPLIVGGAALVVEPAGDVRSWRRPPSVGYIVAIVPPGSGGRRRRRPSRSSGSTSRP